MNGGEIGGENYFRAVMKYDFILIMLGVLGLIACGSGITLLIMFGPLSVPLRIFMVGACLFGVGLLLIPKFNKIKLDTLDKLLRDGKIIAAFYLQQKKSLT